MGPGPTGGRLPAVVTTDTREGRGRSPGVAAFLSFLWPGLGQWYAGKRRAGIVFALPVFIAAAVLVGWLLQGPEWIVLQLLSPGTALTVAVLVGLLGLWRFVSMIDGASTIGLDFRCEKLNAQMSQPVFERRL